MLVGPEPGAAELVAAATARARRRPVETGLLDEQASDSLVSAEVGRLFLAGSVRPGGPSAPRPELSQGQLLLQAQLLRLTRRQRLLLTRRLTERLTIAELAGLVDAPTKVVEQDLAAAQSQLPELELVTLLQTYADAAPGDDAVRAASARRLAISSRRRRRTAVLVGCVLVVAVLVATAPAVIVPRLSGTARPLRTWDTYLQLRLPADWEISFRSISPAVESARLQQRRADGSVQECDVTLGSAGAPEESGAPPAAKGDGDPVRVRWRPGSYRNDVELYSETLTWEYARGAMARVSCESLTDRKLLYEIASSWVRVQRSPGQRVPVAFGALPRPYRVETLYLVEHASASTSSGSPAFGLGSSTDRDAWSMTVSVQPALPRPVIGSMTRSPSPIAGRAVYVNARQDGSLACLAGKQFVCVTAWWAGQSDWPSGAQGPSGVVHDTLAAITLADRLEDRSTWFEADRALG